MRNSPLNPRYCPNKSDVFKTFWIASYLLCIIISFRYCLQTQPQKRVYTVLESVSCRKLRDPPPCGTAWWITQFKCWPKNFTSSSKKQKKYGIKGEFPLVGWCESGDHLLTSGIAILRLMPASDLPTRTTWLGVFSFKITFGSHTCACQFWVQSFTWILLL